MTKYQLILWRIYQKEIFRNYQRKEELTMKKNENVLKDLQFYSIKFSAQALLIDFKYLVKEEPIQLHQLKRFQKV